MGGRRKRRAEGIQTACAPPRLPHPDQGRRPARAYPPEMHGQVRAGARKAAVALRMFTGYDAGKTLHQIRRELQAAGVPTIQGGPEWGMTTIARILR